MLAYIFKKDIAISAFITFMTFYKLPQTSPNPSLWGVGGLNVSYNGTVSC